MTTRRSLLLCLLAVLVWTAAPAACGATVEDFGYQRMTVNGRPALGGRPLIVILADLGNDGDFGRPDPAAYYDRLVFNLLTNRSLNGFALENSGGRFWFTRAGVVGPLQLEPLELQQALTNDVMRGGHFIAAAAQSGFDFAPFDADSNGVITQDELAVLLVENLQDGDDGRARWAHPEGARGQSFQPPGSTVAFQTSACAVSRYVSLATLCHEVFHLLGALDLYGAANGSGNECLSTRLTLMTCTLAGGLQDVPDIFHLDPWHKLQLGWTEPRIRSLPAGGLEGIPAAQLPGADKPLLLYDPARGTDEFFLLEYRTPLLPPSAGANYDSEVADSGLVIWRVMHDGNLSPVLVPRIDAGSFSAEPYWRFCSKCKGLHYIANPAAPIFRACPAGGLHNQDGSSPYAVVKDQSVAPGQHGWSRCQKCAGLFFGPNFAASFCPAGDTHIAAGGDYSLVQNDESAPGQQDWRWCRRCQGLFYGPNLGESDCPAGGRHESTTSGNYAVLLDGLNYVVWAEGAPDFTRGGNTGWHANQVTPSLTWLDGSPTRMRIRVHPFAQATDTITVEWSQEVWVDYTFPGNPAQAELGIFELPFNTLAESAMAAVPGSIVSFKPGTGLESVTVNKRLRLGAPLGPVTIGR